MMRSKSIEVAGTSPATTPVEVRCFNSMGIRSKIVCYMLYGSATTGSAA